jgi:hypothetical protein
MKPNTAFTKKDLVVVLVCIIFLIANIAAIGEGGRKRPKQAVCLSNLLKWGQIFQAYTADNNGFFHSRRIGDPWGYKRMWMYAYKPYYNDLMMRYCPTAANDNRIGGPFGVWNPGYGSWDPTDPGFWVPGEDGPPNGSYGLNRFVINMAGPGFENDPKFWRRAGVKGGAQAPVFMDCMYINLWPSSDDEPPEYDGDWTVGDTQAAACINRHDGFINACFLDFSARKVGLKELWTLKWHRLYDTCGPWTICGGVQPTDWPEWMRDFQDF